MILIGTRLLVTCTFIETPEQRNDRCWNGSALPIGSRSLLDQTHARLAASGFPWSMRMIESDATPAALRSMGITWGIGQFISSFSAQSVTFIYSNALAGKIAIR